MTYFSPNLMKYQNFLYIWTQNEYKNVRCHMVWMCEDLDTIFLQSIWLWENGGNVYKHFDILKIPKTLQYHIIFVSLKQIVTHFMFEGFMFKIASIGVSSFVSWDSSVQVGGTNDFKFSSFHCVFVLWILVVVKQVHFVTPKICMHVSIGVSLSISIVLGINIGLHKTTKWILLNFQGKLFKIIVAIVFWFKPKGK
jgi:hypothetical protein